MSLARLSSQNQQKNEVFLVKFLPFSSFLASQTLVDPWIYLS